MDLLGAPLDVLVFRYSAAVAGSIWASLAVLAISIAIGLWRIRALRFISSVPPAPLDPTGAGAGCAPGRAPAEPSPPGHVDGNATPKARFTTYFDADDGSDENERGDGEETEEEEEAPWGWERRIVTKRGDLGRHRYQYRTAFNDSVVRMRQGRVELTVTAGRLRLPEEGQNGN